MADSEQDLKFCSNCKKDISASNFVMHEVHCRRHITLCEHCKEPIPKAEIDQHFQEQHEKIPCQKCGQRVEKMYLEEHEENDCPKKPQKCLYCELEFPKCDLKGHLDYCGSRTEQCMKCLQFVMLKDQLRHDENDCTRLVSMANNIGDTPDRLGISDQPDYFPLSYARNSHEEQLFGQPEEDLNSFMFDEMSRLLNGRTSEDSWQQLRPVYNSVGTSHQPLLNRRNDITLPKNSNVERWQSADALRNPNISSFRDSGTHPVGPSPVNDGDFDYMLALHLAQDLQSSDSLNNQDSVNTFAEDEMLPSAVMGQTGVTDLSPLSPMHHVYNTSTTTSVEIPCEFCGDPFPEEMIVQHQSGCDRRAVHSPALSDDDPSAVFCLPPDSEAQPDINSARNTGSNPPAHIPIVDNLRHAAAEDWISSGVREGPESMERENTMLPCEFCGALLPVDYLVQHQAVCDADTGASAGHSTEPIPVTVQPKKKTSNILRADNVSNVEKSRSKRRQEDPTLGTTDNPSLRRLSKNVNINSSNSSIGATAAGNIKAMLSETKVKHEAESGPVTHTQSSNRRRRQPLLPSSTTTLTQGGQRSSGEARFPLQHLQYHDNLLGEDKEPTTSLKAVKQSDNRARQTAARQGRVKLRGPLVSNTAQHDSDSQLMRGIQGVASTPSVRPSRERDSVGASGVSQSSSGGPQPRNPRRSGNQVFAGPAKRTTPKRHLPDKPSK